MAKGIPFVKIHGAGNDSIFFHRQSLPAGIQVADFVRQIADRRTGVGADQVLERLPHSDFAVQVWNCDGSQAEMCGNGSRCFAALLDAEGKLPPDGSNFSLEISGKPYLVQRSELGFAISLGKPLVAPLAKLQFRGHVLPYFFVKAPNPHAVFFITSGEGQLPPEAIANYKFLEWGPELERHPLFPERANIEFVVEQKKNNETILLRVEAWERGAGASASCGSGAVAVAAALRVREPDWQAVPTIPSWAT
jgi:diaminopimelate epimerase